MKDTSSFEPIVFKSEKELSKWFQKNQNKKNELWLLIAKKIAQFQTITQAQAMDQCICYGWTIVLIRSIDLFSYQIKACKRRPKSVWGTSYTKRFLELKKNGLVKPSGLLAYEQRDRKKSEVKVYVFSPKYLAQFKKNKSAWTFFSKQTPSYQKEMTRWVMSAMRVETRDRRFAELLEDSAGGTKLKRVLKMIEKYQNKKMTYPVGQTPIEVAKNIGPLTGVELRSVGIETVEQLKSLGWEKCFYKLVELYPQRINLNMIYGLIGAVEDISYLKLDGELKAEARSFLKQYKSEFR